MTNKSKPLNASREVLAAAASAAIKTDQDYLFVGCNGASHHVGACLQDVTHVLEFITDLYCYSPALAAAMHAVTAFKNGQSAQLRFKDMGMDPQAYAEVMMDVAEHDAGSMHYGSYDPSEDEE